MVFQDNTLIDALATSLNIQSPTVLVEVTEKVFGALLLYAIERHDEVSVKKMLGKKNYLVFVSIQQQEEALADP